METEAEEGFYGGDDDEVSGGGCCDRGKQKDTFGGERISRRGLFEISQVL